MQRDKELIGRISDAIDEAVDASVHPSVFHMMEAEHGSAFRVAVGAVTVETEEGELVVTASEKEVARSLGDVLISKATETAETPEQD